MAHFTFPIVNTEYERKKKTPWTVNIQEAVSNDANCSEMVSRPKKKRQKRLQLLLPLFFLVCFCSSEYTVGDLSLLSMPSDSVAIYRLRNSNVCFIFNLSWNVSVQLTWPIPWNHLCHMWIILPFYCFEFRLKLISPDDIATWR